MQAATKLAAADAVGVDMSKKCYEGVGSVMKNTVSRCHRVASNGGEHKRSNSARRVNGYALFRVATRVTILRMSKSGVEKSWQ